MFSGLRTLRMDETNNMEIYFITIIELDSTSAKLMMKSYY